MTKLRSRGHEAAASLLVPSIALLFVALALLAVAIFPASGLAAEEGEGEPPLGLALSFSPAPLQFDKTTAGTESPGREVDVLNLGANGAIDKIVLEGGDAGDFKISGGGCGWLEAGQHCGVWIAFAPGSVGEKTTSLVVYPKEAPAQSVALDGTAVAPQLSFDPGSYDFGIQRVNRGEASTSLQLTNSGEAMTQLGSLGFGGEDPSNFWTGNSDCWGGRQLQPGESCNVQVGFNPWDTVTYEAELQAHANGGSFSASLAGTGGRAQVEPGSTPSLFGAVTVGAVGPVETIVFTNHGNLPGNFFIGIVAGGDAGSFKLLDEGCSAGPLAPGAACTAHVRFTPQSAGAKLARLALFGDDDGGTMALLSGEGVAAAATLAPGAFDFGSQAAATRSAAQTFVVGNDGSAPLELDGVAIAGADPDQFALSGDECSGATLVPGAACLVRVRFAPDSAGAKAATLRLRGPGAGFTAALSGTATEQGWGAAANEEDPAAHAATWSRAPRPATRARNRRFARGNSLPGSKRPRPHRVAVRASALPR